MGRIDVKPEITKTARSLSVSLEEEKVIEDNRHDGLIEDNLKFIREKKAFLKYLQDRGFACKVRKNG